MAPASTSAMKLDFRKPGSKAQTVAKAVVIILAKSLSKLKTHVVRKRDMGLERWLSG